MISLTLYLFSKDEEKSSTILKLVLYFTQKAFPHVKLMED